MGWWLFRGFVAAGVALFAWYHTDSGTESHGEYVDCPDQDPNTCWPH